MSADLDPIRYDVEKPTLSCLTSGRRYDWQAITDMVILRYATELSNIVSGSLEMWQLLHERVERLLTPFH
jgi:hypothetical protein